MRRSRLGKLAHLFHTLGLGNSILCACAIAVTARDAIAIPAQMGGGYDYSSGPADQITRSALAFGNVGLGPAGNLTVAGLRYDDSRIGEGVGIVGGLGVPVPLGALQLWGYRYIGDEAFRAWRIKTGPRIAIPGGSSLDLFYAHYEDNADAKTDGGIAELGVPVKPGLTGRANAALGFAPAEPRSAQAGLGVTWAPVRFVELLGDVGLARNGTLTGTSFPARRSLLPLVGGGSPGGSSTVESDIESTWQVGIRVTFP